MKSYDVNNDGIVSSYDQGIIKSYVAKLFNFDAYDINNDGDVDISDYMEWRRHFDFADIDNDSTLRDYDSNDLINAIKEGSTTLRMDLNNDNKVDNEDVEVIKRLLNNASAISRKLDVNKDGLITEVDGFLLRRIIDICRDFLNRMDVNGDGDVDMSDVVEIEKHYTK